MVISGSSPTASNPLLVGPAQINYAGTHSASQLHYKSFLVLCIDTSNINDYCTIFKTCTNCFSSCADDCSIYMRVTSFSGC